MNTSLVVQTGSASTLPAAVPIFGRTGKQLGTVQHFTGNKSAKSIKEALKAQNPTLKGKALTEKVNEVLTGEVELRQQLGVAWLQGAFQMGWICDVGVLRKNRGGLNLVKLDTKAEARMKALELLGLSEEEFKTFKALTAQSGN